jgi:hypothetical protein
MIQAVRASLSGVSALNSFINDEKPATRDDALTLEEAGLLACAPVAHEWVQLNDLRTRMKEDGVTVKDLTISLRSLNERKLLDIFRDITDSTLMRVRIGAYTFHMQWTVLRKQVQPQKEGTEWQRVCGDELRARGWAIICGTPDIRVELA